MSQVLLNANMQLIPTSQPLIAKQRSVRPAGDDRKPGADLDQHTIKIELDLLGDKKHDSKCCI